MRTRPAEGERAPEKTLEDLTLEQRLYLLERFVKSHFEKESKPFPIEVPDEVLAKMLDAIYRDCEIDVVSVAEDIRHQKMLRQILADWLMAVPGISVEIFEKR